MKAYLCFRKQPIIKTHDVVMLVELCIDLNTSFKELLEDAKSFAGYDTNFRYPDEILYPDEDDVEDAIIKAERIFNFVKEQIKKESQ